MVLDINDNQPETPEDARKRLEKLYCYVWDTAELSEQFEVLSFMAPFVIARDKTTGQKGTLTFQHRPRFYFDWQEDY